MSRNAAVAARLEEFADRLEAKDVDYKPRAYRRAAENVRDHPESVDQLAAEGPAAVGEIDGVGDAIASKIVEFVETGSIAELEELREELPVDIEALGRVEGLGPKRIGELYRHLGVETLDDLEAAAADGEIQDVPGFGAKTEANILENVRFAREAAERTPLGAARPLAERVVARLREAGVERAAPAGSIRRWCPTVGDVDIVAAAADREAAIAALVEWDAATPIEAGDTRASVRIDDERVDLRVVAPDAFGAALQYFTGSRDHNVRLRERAIDRGLRMNEYGVFRPPAGTDAPADDEGSDPDETLDAATLREDGERLAGDSEDEMYAAVDLPTIPPELREDRGEIAAAADDALPDLLTRDAVRGDLHTHTDWSDGALSIDDWIDAAAAAGHDYLGITDHATGPGMVGGVGIDDETLREQLDVVRDAAADAPIDVFAGVETNIDAAGALSTADDVLDACDIVVASPHSGLGQDDDAATDRLVRALRHPSVDVLGHPTGRLLGRRSGLSFDVDRVVTCAADNDVALEVNANPARLDCDGGTVRAAIEAGATVAINTDAHSPAEFDHLLYGVHTARRGWAEPEHVLNTRSAAGVRDFLGS